MEKWSPITEFLVPKEGGSKIDLLMGYFNPLALTSTLSFTGIIEIVCPGNEPILASPFTHLILE